MLQPWRHFLNWQTHIFHSYLVLHRVYLHVSTVWSLWGKSFLEFWGQNSGERSVFPLCASSPSNLGPHNRIVIARPTMSDRDDAIMRVEVTRTSVHLKHGVHTLKNALSWPEFCLQIYERLSPQTPNRERFPCTTVTWLPVYKPYRSHSKCFLRKCFKMFTAKFDFLGYENEFWMYDYRSRSDRRSDRRVWKSFPGEPHTLTNLTPPTKKKKYCHVINHDEKDFPP